MYVRFVVNLYDFFKMLSAAKPFLAKLNSVCTKKRYVNKGFSAHTFIYLFARFRFHLNFR